MRPGARIPWQPLSSSAPALREAIEPRGAVAFRDLGDVLELQIRGRGVVRLSRTALGLRPPVLVGRDEQWWER